MDLDQRKNPVLWQNLFGKAIAGEECTIYGDGNQTRNFIYIEDLVQAILLSIECNIGEETFQITTGSEHSVLEIVTATKKVLAQKNIQMRIAHDAPRLGDVKRNFSDTTKYYKSENNAGVDVQNED